MLSTDWEATNSTIMEPDDVVEDEQSAKDVKKMFRADGAMVNGEITSQRSKSSMDKMCLPVTRDMYNVKNMKTQGCQVCAFKGQGVRLKGIALCIHHSLCLCTQTVHSKPKELLQHVAGAVTD